MSGSELNTLTAMLVEEVLANGTSSTYAITSRYEGVDELIVQFGSISGVGYTYFDIESTS